MIVMDVKLNNLYAFKNFHINMAYPKKIVNSSLGDESLIDFPNFRYKKVNILLGSNATGKSTFGKVLMNIFNFIAKQNDKFITTMITDKYKPASFSIDCVTNHKELVRVECVVTPPKEYDPSLEYYEISDINVTVNSVMISLKDSYESCAKKIEGMNIVHCGNYIEELEKVRGLAWFFQYPETGIDKLKLNRYNESEKYCKILENILKALDPSIKEVNKSKEVDNSYIIRTAKKDVFMQEDEITNREMLSSGTLAGIEIAGMLTSIIEDKNTFYYCDEKFSYIHSDIEKAVLSVMINCLKDNTQLFFTTHNTDIVELDLPKHSFTFLKKDIYDEDMPIKCISASDYLKRNTDSIKSAIDNDLFMTAPATRLIYDIQLI